MAKITITLEDRRDETGKPTVSLDMTEVPIGPFGSPLETTAVRMSRTMFEMVANEKALGSIPACRWQSSPKTVH